MSGVVRRAVIAAAAVAAVTVVPLVTSPPAGATISASTQPAADPGFAKFGSSYYLYSTSNALGVFPVLRSSSDTTANSFTKVGNAYAAAPSGYTALWAPHVILRGSKYFMFFTASHNGALGCIFWAVSNSPIGGFGAPHQIVCAPSGYEAIDSTIYHSAAGDDYVVWKRGHYTPGYIDGTYYGGFPHGDFWINAQKLSINTTTGTVGYAAGSRPFTLASQLNSTVMEAPTLFSYGNKVWLFVSRGRYDTNAYSTQAWSSVDFFHPFHIVNTVMSQGQGFGYGPGGAEAINEGGVIRIAYHVWDANKPTPSAKAVRVPRIGRVLWNSSGNPYIL